MQYMDFIKNKEKIISNILDSVSLKMYGFLFLLLLFPPLPKNPLCLKIQAKRDASIILYKF